MNNFKNMLNCNDNNNEEFKKIESKIVNHMYKNKLSEDNYFEVYSKNDSLVILVSETSRHIVENLRRISVLRLSTKNFSKTYKDINILLKLHKSKITLNDIKYYFSKIEEAIQQLY